MKFAAILLIVISLAVVGYFGTQEAVAPPPVSLQDAARDDVTLRSTAAGDIVGFVGEQGARTWLGVPFAQPPVAELRWQPPRPARPWSGILETLSAKPRCPQLTPNTGTGQPGDPAAVAGSEDCLYLNIYAPANARDLPVMLWVHGGGNSVGTGATYNGSVLATRERVVVITINYRLGPLGWFSHPKLKRGEPAADSGNYGTLDIIKALAWTQDNIAEFGGDPARVTVFGESAGGSNVLTLVASPLAADLFHGGIAQSGRFDRVAPAVAQSYASDGGHKYSAPEIVNQLLMAEGRAADAAAARTMQDAMSQGELRDYLYNKSVNELFAGFDSRNFGMLATPEVFADGHVLPTLSAEQIFSNANNHNSVPMILGTTRDEPSLFMFAQPRHVDSASGTPRLRDPAGYRREVKYAALAWKERGVDRIASQLSAAGNQAVFAYRFDWDEQGVVNGIDLSMALGAAHAVELPFVFGSFDSQYFTSDLYAASDERHVLARSVTGYWSEFAASGDPGQGRDGKQPRWLAWGTDNKTTLILDTPSDQGIFMNEGVVTAASIKAAILADTSIADNLERCRLYAVAFAGGPHFDAGEFAAFGEQGCSEFDPEQLSGS
jgi:para-nitrobenzyl esterase